MITDDDITTYLQVTSKFSGQVPIPLEDEAVEEAMKMAAHIANVAVSKKDMGTLGRCIDVLRELIEVRKNRNLRDEALRDSLESITDDARKLRD